MIVNDAQIAVTVLNSNKTVAAGAVSPTALAAGSGPAAILDLATGKGGVSVPGYGETDETFAVKLKQSLQDMQIQNRIEFEEAFTQLDGAVDRLEAGERVSAGDFIIPALTLKGLLEEKGLLSDAVEQRLDALTDQATQEVNLKSLQAIVDVLEEEGVAAEDIDAAAEDVKDAVAEQIEAELSDNAGAEIAEAQNKA